MNLHCIKTERCPVCGEAQVVSEYVEKRAGGHRPVRHVNGQLFEHREFVCGMLVRWSPNFDREEFIRECAYDPAVLDKIRRRTVLVARLVDMIKTADVDDAFKQDKIWKVTV